MSSISPDPTHDGSPAGPRCGPDERASPGWLEILSGVAVFLLIGFGGVRLVHHLGLDPIVYGLIVAAASGIAGIAGFLVASSLRVRSWPVFGLRRASWRWLAAGVGGGLLVWVASRLLTALYVVIAGDTSNVQEIYNTTGAADPTALVLSLLFLAVLTPIGEELLFRGIVTTTLLRYGPVAGVLGSALIFAAVHGANSAAITAVVTGLVAGELRRRSGSVWPGVETHLVNNLVGIGLGIFVTAAS